MSFWSNPWKATKSFINRYIPGGKYLTGSDLERHKRNYEESRDRYNNYGSEAQTTIDNLSGEIQQSMQGLRSLEEQQYYYSNRSYEMENQLNQYASQYDSGLKNIETQRARLSSSSQQLKQSFESLKQKAPALEARMREVEQLPGAFQNLYDRVAQQEESLRGLTEEEAGSAIAKHQQDVESLKKQCQAIEEKIRYSMNDITREHKNISMEKAELEHQLGNYQASQDRLLQDTSKFDQARYQLTSMIDQYKQQQNRAEQIETDYANRQSHIQGLQDKLRSYSGSAQSQLDSYAHDVKWRAGKYEKSAGITGLVQGGVLGALTFGATMGLAGLAGFGGLGAGIAAGTGSGLVGIGHYMNTSNIANKLGNLEKIDLANNHQYDGMSGNLDQMARYGRSGLEKMPIAELGGLKQAVEHFNMRSVPRLQDLPKLSESLGKIVSLKDIEGLTLGLPSMTAASKKYNYEVLYDFYRNGMADKIIPLTGMENILPTEIEQNQCRDAIYKAFYIDIFRMQKENKEMTATEMQIRTEEQYRLMSPMVGRIESELLNPLIMAIYQTLIKYNRVPILEGANSPPEIEIEYVSPLSRAQKTSAIASVEQVLGFFQRSGISNFFPEIYDNINWDECFKLFFELRGVPSSILKNEQEVLQIRQQRKIMQMQQLQQQQQIQG